MLSQPRSLPLCCSLVVSLTSACNRSQPPTPAASAEAGAAPLGSAAPAAPASAAAPLPSLAAFEGEIDATVKEAKSKTGPTTLTLLVKDRKLRVDLPESLTKQGGSAFGGAGYFIVDTAAKKMLMVSDPRRQVFVLDLDRSGDMLKNLGTPHGKAAPSAPTPPPKVTKTGRYETAAGYKCEDWDVSGDHREATVCVADEGASWLHLPLTGVPTERLWMAELFDGKHVPLRFIAYDKDGTTEEARVDVTKVDPRPVQASQFEVPAGYTTIDLAKMMQGLQTMPGMPAPKPQP